MWGRWRPLFLLLLLGAGPAPPRVVSLNPCLDAILLELADPSEIAALSHYSQDPSQSAVAAQAKAYRFTWGSAEEVAALHPNLVLASGMGAASANGVLPRLGIKVARFAVPSSVGESLAQIDRIAALLGQEQRGRALKARILVALKAAEPKPGAPKLPALVYEYHGLASAPGTLMDELMRRTGFTNQARRYGLRRTGLIPLEVVIADPPKVLLAGRLAPGEPTWADRVLSHPALRALRGRSLRESFPEVLMFCAGPSMAAAAAALARAREDALAGVSR